MRIARMSKAYQSSVRCSPLTLAITVLHQHKLHAKWLLCPNHIAKIPIYQRHHQQRLQSEDPSACHDMHACWTVADEGGWARKIGSIGQISV